MPRESRQLVPPPQPHGQLRRQRTAGLTLSGLLVLAVGVWSSGCSTALKPNEGVKSDLAELRERVLELQRKAAVQEVEMARLRRQLAEFEAGQRVADRGASQDAVEEERAVVESSPVTVAPIGNIEQEDLDPDDSDAGSFAESRVESPRTTPTSEAISQAAQEIYDEGYTLYHQSRYVDSEASFREFLELYPDNDLADNAQYWIGECRYANKDYRGALSAFQETVNRHPEGNKVPDALLKTGQVLEQLGDVSSARQSYREVQRRFPDSAAAVVASERLAKL